MCVRRLSTSAVDVCGLNVLSFQDVHDGAADMSQMLMITTALKVQKVDLSARHSLHNKRI